MSRALICIRASHLVVSRNDRIVVVIVHIATVISAVTNIHCVNFERIHFVSSPYSVVTPGFRVKHTLFLASRKSKNGRTPLFWQLIALSKSPDDRTRLCEYCNLRKLRKDSLDTNSYHTYVSVDFRSVPGALLWPRRGVRGPGRRGPLRLREKVRTGQAQGVRHRRAAVRQQMRTAQSRLFDRGQHRDGSFAQVLGAVR